MADMEKVISGLQRCRLMNKLNCDKCPYDYNGRGNGKSECTAELASDVLELLKEQKIAMKPKNIDKVGENNVMDREKVLTWLEICGKNNDCSGCCPYSENGFGEYGQCRESLMADAYDLLKEQETMHWISVKDRLPTYAELKDDCVLVLFDDGAICSTGFDECIEDESIFGEWRQNFDPITLGATDSYWMPLEGVTHWMPIPKLMQKGR